uniref:Uncharacterized protein n=1 Tax=Anguilla anguilla TaxID=7936 RepID=A0A0E9RI36_ANGAN
MGRQFKVPLHCYSFADLLKNLLLKIGEFTFWGLLFRI